MADGSAKLSMEGGFDGSSPNEVSSLARLSFREVQRLLEMTLMEELEVKYILTLVQHLKRQYTITQ